MVCGAKAAHHGSTQVLLNKKVRKGAWRMPRLSEAKKDVISCEKLRGSAIGRDPQISEWDNLSG